MPDELARANGLRAGDLDVIGGDWVAPQSPRRASALKADGMTVVAEPGTATTILGFSPKSPIMQDKAVRDTIFLGVDRAAGPAMPADGRRTERRLPLISLCRTKASPGRAG